MSGICLATVAEVSPSGLDRQVEAYIRAPFDVGVEETAEGLEYSLRWSSAVAVLGADGVHAAMDSIAPVSGIESIGQVEANYRGVHEDDERNKAVVRTHRRIFGEHWRDMGESRRMYASVLSGTNYDQIKFDGADLCKKDASLDKHSALTSRYFIQGLIFNLIQNNNNSRLREYFKDPNNFENESVPLADRVAVKLARSLFPALVDTDDGRIRVEEIDSYHIHEIQDRLSADEMARISFEALANLDEDETDSLLDLAYNKFIDQNQLALYVSRRAFRTENDMPLQAHYNQRLPLKIPHGFPSWEWASWRWMEFMSGLDEPDYASIPGEHDDVSELPVLEPVLRWRNIDGERRFVLNHELSGIDATVDSGGRIKYRDTLLGMMLVALVQPDVRASWPKEARLPNDPELPVRKQIKVPEPKQIQLGAAQAPLLTLISREQLIENPMFRRMEELAEKL